jgi:hypothetical protein
MATNTEKAVSTDPGPESVPVTTPRPTADQSDDAQSPVIGGLEAHADDPKTTEPIAPHRLVGERAAKGSNARPG